MTGGLTVAAARGYLASLPVIAANPAYVYTSRLAPIRFGVVHSMEAPEKLDTAEAVMRYLQNAPSDRPASVHAGVDVNSTVIGVPAEWTAWHAGGGNSDTVGIEHSGYHYQTRAEWLDPAYGVPMLRDQSARVAAAYSVGYGIPIRRATVYDYVNAQLGHPYQGGWLGHVDITAAARILGRKTAGHVDPGDEFPYDVWLPWVAAWASPPTIEQPTTGADNMARMIPYPVGSTSPAIRRNYPRVVISDDGTALVGVNGARFAVAIDGARAQDATSPTPGVSLFKLPHGTRAVEVVAATDRPGDGFVIALTGGKNPTATGVWRS